MTSVLVRNKVPQRFFHLLGSVNQPQAAVSVAVRDISFRRTQTTVATKVQSKSRTNSVTEDVKLFSEIPGPRKFPLIKGAWIFMPILGGVRIVRSHVLLQKLLNDYGKIVKVEIPGQPDTVWLFDPDDVETLYRNEGVWPLRMAFTSVTHYRKNYRKDIFEENAGLLVEQEEAWYNHRSKLQQLLLRPSSAMFYFSPIQEVTDEFVKRIRSIIQPASQELPGCMLPELYRWTLESVGVVALDTRLGCLSDNHKAGSEASNLIDAVINLLESLEKLEMGIKAWKYFPTPGWNKMKKYDDLFSSIALKYTLEAMERIKQRPASTEEDLTLLEKILIRDPNPTTAILMSLDMLEAAIDTTSTAVAFVMYMLAKNPEKQEKLHQEIASFLPSKDSSLTPQIIGQMRYMKACIKETLRLIPVFIWLNRVAPQDLVIRGYKIPKGTMINVGFHTIMRQEEYFPEPMKYYPERWLKDSKEKIHPFSFLPFSYGPRMCLGRRFAEMEMWLLVTKLIQNFKVEYHYEDMDIYTKFINRPDRPLKFRLIERS